MKRILLLICYLYTVSSVSPAFAVVVYGVGSSGSEGVYVVDTVTGTATLLFATPDITWYGATDGDNTTSFFATPDGGSLYRINIVNQTATPIGSYGGIQICGLAYNESTESLYGTNNRSLYSIDITTGIPTLIGSFNGPDAVWAMDYDPSIDQLVAFNNNDQSMYYINMLTGKATFIGPSGQTRITDIWYDSVSNGMYGVGSYPHRLFTIDTSTGNAYMTGTIDEALTGLGNPIPEPATSLLLIFGSLALRSKLRVPPTCKRTYFRKS